MGDGEQHIIKINDLGIGYKSPVVTPIFDHINLYARLGEMVALIGRNGTGKSTLLRTLVRLQHKLYGDIMISGNELESISSVDMAKLVSYVSTEIIHTENLKVYDLVALGRFPYTNWLGVLKEEDHRAVCGALEMVGMTNFSNKNVHEISDGERQKVMIARAVAQDTPIMILDEPTAFLDLPNKYEVISLLGCLAKDKNKCIIFSSHDLNIAIREADMIWMMMNKGIQTGAPEDLILSGKFDDMFENAALRFNVNTGDFFIPKKTNKQICVNAKGLARYWTVHALNRIGYKVVDDKDVPGKIVVQGKTNKITWQYVYKKEIRDFESLYKLLVYLK